MLTLFRHRRLIASLARREIDMRFRGSFFGTSWYVINSLIILMMYTLVFGTIFKANWPMTRPGAASTTGNFAITIFSGLIIYNLVSECLTKAPNLITMNANFVKKVVFPLEILPVVSLLASLFNAGIAWLVLIAISFVVGIPPAPTALLAPVVLIPLIPAILGLSWLFASLGVYLRDIAQVVPLLATVMLFLAPVFYPRSSVPEPYRTYSLINPITMPIEQFRAMTFEGALPDIQALAIGTVVGCIVAMAAYAWFTATKRGFADVL